MFFCRSGAGRNKEGDGAGKYFCTAIPATNLIATTEAEAGAWRAGCLKRGAATGKIEHFWTGVWKNLFLPFKQQTRRLHPGDEVLVSLYIDKSDRLCATMKVYHFLKTNSPS